MLSLWCYRCKRFVPVEFVNIKYNIFRKRPCDFCYVLNNKKKYLNILDTIFIPEISKEILEYLVYKEVRTELK